MSDSLALRAPKNLNLQWQSGPGEEWSLKVACTISSADEGEAVLEIVRIVVRASTPPGDSEDGR